MLNLNFPKGRLFCVALVFCVVFFEQLGDESFSLWYVQHISSTTAGGSNRPLLTLYSTPQAGLTAGSDSRVLGANPLSPYALFLSYRVRTVFGGL